MTVAEVVCDARHRECRCVNPPHSDGVHRCGCGSAWIGDGFDNEQVTRPLSRDHLRWWL